MLKNPLHTLSVIRENLAKAVKATGLSKVLIGLSGGADSALVAIAAVEAVGKENVKAIFMPSVYTKVESAELAQRFAEDCLNIEFQTYPINFAHEAFQKILFDGGDIDVTGVPDENIQARVRGVILMAVANVEYRLVLATSNRSEALMGYCTIYGDTVGFREVIGGLFKTEVYQILEDVYKQAPRDILRRIIDRPPSAELSPRQLDTDLLPPYEVLDLILAQLPQYVTDENIVKQAWRITDKLVEHVADAVEQKFPDLKDDVEKLVHQVLETVLRNGWKLLQYPPVIPSKGYIL